MYVYVYVCMYICMYVNIYTYIYIYMYVCRYVYVCIQRGLIGSRLTPFNLTVLLLLGFRLREIHEILVDFAAVLVLPWGSLTPCKNIYIYIYIIIYI